jgi:hypothetical protein
MAHLTRAQLIEKYLNSTIKLPFHMRMKPAAEFCVLTVEEQDALLKPWIATYLAQCEAECAEHQAQVDKTTATIQEVKDANDAIK